MKRGGISRSILVILALQLALLLAGTQSLLADDLPAIRLPSDAKGEGNHAAGEGNDKEKPWGDCCDVDICNQELPPRCTCADVVESCASACKKCEKVFSNPPSYVCRDLYDFDLEDWLDHRIPRCNKPKPWGDCCDCATCSRKRPPRCICADKVESCSLACKSCNMVSEDPPRYVCQDIYQFTREDWFKHGIPKCT